MTSPKNPDSNRSKKRANRNFTKSRCERRADHRHAVAVGAYNDGVKANSGNGAAAFTMPGKQNHW